MKAKRLTVVAFLLAAIMLLGVGFAAISDTLIITGNAGISSSEAESELNQDVYFSAVSTYQADPSKPQSKSYEAYILPDNNDEIHFDATGLSAVGDYVEITATIANEFTEDVVVTPTIKEAAGDTSYFKISSDWRDAQDQVQPKTIAKGSNGNPTTQTITIRLEVVQAPTAAVTATFKVELKAVAGN